jgi:hypothetical protein
LAHGAQLLVAGCRFCYRCALAERQPSKQVNFVPSIQPRGEV